MIAKRVLDPDRTITVVSGMPRSGTSMMMQMVEAAGVELHCDGGRVADTDNPRGYFELEATKRLPRDASFLTKSCAKAVKIVAPLLTSLPADFEYRVIFIDRDMEEIMASQQAMMEHAGQEQGSDAVDRVLARAFHKRIAEAKRWLEDSGNVRVYYVSHADVLDSPKEASKDLADFLEATGAIALVGWPKDERRRVLSRMAETVEPDLYRQRQKSD
jgi:hypothetical protein